MLKWGDARTRLGKRKFSDARPASLIQSVKAVRVDSVISNCTGRSHEQRSARRDRRLDLRLKQLAGPQLAVDAKIEQRQFVGAAVDLKPDADRPNFFEFGWRFLTNKFAFVPGRWNYPNSEFIHSRLEESQPDTILSGAARCRRLADIADRVRGRDSWAVSRLWLTRHKRTFGLLTSCR
jgi:hypothetical protein